jgi:hypothetical protein
MNMKKQKELGELESLVAYYDRQTKMGLILFPLVMGLLVVAVIVCAVVL